MDHHRGGPGPEGTLLGGKGERKNNTRPPAPGILPVGGPPGPALVSQARGPALFFIPEPQ